MTDKQTAYLVVLLCVLSTLLVARDIVYDTLDTYAGGFQFHKGAVGLEVYP